MARLSMRLLLVVVASCVSSVLGAATLSMGGLGGVDQESDQAFAEVRTDIALSSLATASGTIDSAWVSWSVEGCSAAVKIKVFRRVGDSLVFVAERGPFTPGQIALTPPIAVEQGDVLGIARLTNCGSPQVWHPPGHLSNPGYAAYAGDIASDVSLAAARRSGGFLSVYATGVATEVLASVLPVAGSTPGAFGSYFRTGMQLANQGTSVMTGRFVFHPAGLAGSSADPSLDFSIEPRTTLSFDDVVESMGQTGLGTLDVVLPSASRYPFTVARVYNDGGESGTSGFTENLVAPTVNTCPDQVLYDGATGFLLTPPDATAYRFNIGVRSLLAGAEITFGVRDANGIATLYATKSYVPTFFEQQSLEALLGGPVAANQVIEVSVSGGTAIVYGATVDNTTNDSSIQFATVKVVNP